MKEVTTSSVGGGLRQIDEEDPVGEVRQLACRGLDRDPGLACAAGAEERHQLGSRDQSVDAADELPPPDERRPLRGQGGDVTPHRVEWGEVGPQGRSGHLEQAVGAVEVAQAVVAEVDDAAVCESGRRPVRRSGSGHRGPQPSSGRSR